MFAGIVWHPTMRTDQNLIAQGDLPRFVMDSYEECRGPPRLFLLDKYDFLTQFTVAASHLVTVYPTWECESYETYVASNRFDVAGAGACLKRYTDPSFFKVDSSSSGMMNAEVQRE